MDADPPDSIVFPEGFLWGVAGSAHQIEGGNTNNDWWDFEHAPGSNCADSSGDACDSYHRWAEDIDLVAGMGLGAYRFSLEWSRIEPAEGEVGSKLRMPPTGWRGSSSVPQRISAI